MKVALFVLFLINFKTLACEDQGQKLNIIYINGIINTPSDAQASLAVIEDEYRSHDSFTPEVCFEVFYNQSLGPLDLIEVMDQKLKENIFPGTSFNRLFSGYTYYFTLRRNFYPRFKKLLKIAPTIIISHSQGNLFANELYELAEKDFEQKFLNENFANLQVASTIKSLLAKNADYITLKEDRVVKLLGPSALPSNFSAPNSSTFDPLSHSFVTIYLNRDVVTNDNNSLVDTFHKKLLGLYQQIID